MAKPASLLDKISNPIGVKWALKENEDGKLEWHSDTKGGTIAADIKDKKKRGKVVETRHGAKRAERTGSSVTNRQTKPTGGNMHGNRHGSPNRQRKRAPRHSFVLLDDIKAVAYDQLVEIEQISLDFDRIVFTASAFDNFLYFLLYYFDCFFKRQELELKAAASTSIEAGQLERKLYANSCARVEFARKRLGRSYCHLVLGLGLENAHHMGCGSKRVSQTHRDRSLYETMYSYCCFVVWVAFRRKHFDVIKKEMGRILRSDTFNPAIRVKNAPENEEDEKTDVKNPKKKMSPAEYRRLHPRRPAIKTIINQRSPAVVSILPSSKEESTHLFMHTRSPSPSSILASANATLENDSALHNVLQELEQIEIEIQNRTIRIGILHDSMENYNPTSLQGGGNDGEANHDEEGEGNEEDKEDFGAGGTEGAKLPDGDPGLSRQGTAISQATTEAPSEIL